MAQPDFAEINQKTVGYQLIKPNQQGEPYRLEVLTFENFILPYSCKAETPRQVYSRLEEALASAIRQQESIADGERPVRLDALATATLRREAMTNALQLIRQHYLRQPTVPFLYPLA